MIYVLDKSNGGEISAALGKRPDKLVDAEYLRKSPFNGKYMFWSEEQGKYVHVRAGAQFEVIEGQPPRLLPTALEVTYG